MRNFQKTIESILMDDKRYGVGAYVFVRMALDFTVKRACAKDPRRTERHVSAAELLEGVRDFALETFGPMKGAPNPISGSLDVVVNPSVM